MILQGMMRRRLARWFGTRQDSEGLTKPARARLVLFAFGDFAFNLFWQSVMLFLLFYYTEALRLPVETAAFIYMLASIWDGFVNLAAGLLADGGRRRRSYRGFLVLGAVPLGLGFVLTYLPPPGTGIWAIAAVLGGHLLFRTLYALLNVPYLAMSAQISQDSRDRALIAGLRMLFGTAAAVTVALGTQPIGAWLTGGSHSADAYFAVAGVFAVLGAAILMIVGLTAEEIVPPAPDSERPSLMACLRSLAANRAFLTLSAAMLFMIIGATVLNKSILYYYKYYLADEAAGQVALASMSAVSAAAVPLWIFATRRLGARTAWFAAVAIGAATLGGFAILDIDRTAPMQLFLIVMQVALIGLNLAFWTMLPNTIEYGERSSGLRPEGTAFGVAALLQRVAIGAATGLLGLMLGAVGYVPDVPQAPVTLAGMRWTIALVPLAFLLLSAVFMAMNPLKRGAHAGIVAELARKREERLAAGRS